VVEGLGHADERGFCRVEDLDDLGEVGKAAGEAINLVDHHHVHLAGADVGQQCLQPGALHVAAGEAAVVIEVWHQLPALVPLREDVGSTGLALGIEAVEGLVESLLGRFAGVDRATQAPGRVIGNRTP
jgi:hypothetical protein